jgi:hypothetical protein
MTDDTNRTTDIREALYNDRLVGPAPRIQRPREGVVRVSGLVIDLDADILKPNPWFPPGDTAESFYAAIRPALDRHPVLRHAEVRDSGRWLHAIIHFAEPVDLKTARDQKRWTALHRVLTSSVPSDPGAPALIALTRPAGSTNSKTGRTVRVLREAAPVPATVVTDWAEEVGRKPFATLGRVFFGERVAPCPFCGTEGSHLDVGDVVGFCYGGPCRHVRVRRVLEPFLRGPQDAPAGGEPEKGGGGAQDAGPEAQGECEAGSAGAPGSALPVISVTQDVVLEIDPRRVGTITIRLAKPRGRRGRPRGIPQATDGR